MIKLTNLNKTYKNNSGVFNINAQFEKGKVYGLFGRNGSGKSTLLNLISNKVIADSGDIRINENILNQDLDLDSFLYELTEENHFNSDLTINKHFENIKNLRCSFNAINAFDLSLMFNLNTNRKLSELSQGELSIFKICVALSMDVEYLLLDEPLKNLDVNHRQMFYNVLLEYYQEKNNTIIISTNLVEEISNIIEEIVILSEGKIIKSMNAQELLESSYVISGEHLVMTDYLKDSNPYLVKHHSHFTEAYIIGRPDLLDEKGISIRKVPLQKMVISMTKNYGREK